MANPTADPDGDGLTNAWEAILGHDPDNPDSDSTRTTADEAGNGIQDGQEDFDGDGIPNAVEIAHGYDPLDPNDPAQADLSIAKTAQVYVFDQHHPHHRGAQPGANRG